jgi:LCP family protein required for cell wall assembly
MGKKSSRMISDVVVPKGKKQGKKREQDQEQKLLPARAESLLGAKSDIDFEEEVLADESTAMTDKTSVTPRKKSDIKESVPPKKKTRKKWSKLKKIIVFSLLGILLAIFAYVGFFVNRVTSTLGDIFEGNVMDFITGGYSLRVDEFGRANILVFGTSEDQDGHGGDLLADSIMIFSINPETKEGNMLNIPRDLWVNYEHPCMVGFSGRINAVYFCALMHYNNDQHAAALAFTRKVGEVIGTEVQYYAAVNYAVVRELVDALGGIYVDVHTHDPRGIYDVTTGIRLPAGVQRLDGETALQLSRARNARGGFGLPRSNFDREIN